MNIKLVKNYNQIRPDRATLFCFPFAGGGASAYNSWVQKMKDKVTVCPIQLPGREEKNGGYGDFISIIRAYDYINNKKMCKRLFTRFFQYCEFLVYDESYYEQNTE